MKYIPGSVPAHVVAIHGSARAFKALKRRQLREAQKVLDGLFTGCAFFPCGNRPLEQVRRALEEVEQSISAKNWGR